MIIGIDPGKSGALAALTHDRTIIEIFRFKDGYKDARTFLRNQHHNIWRVYVEEVNAAPIQGRRQGTTSMFTFGREFGTVLEMTFNCHTEMVKPYRWQTVVQVPPKRHTRESYHQRKKRIRQHAEKLFPTVKMTADIADALLIAEYGCKILENNVPI